MKRRSSGWLIALPPAVHIVHPICSRRQCQRRRHHRAVVIIVVVVVVVVAVDCGHVVVERTHPERVGHV